MLTRLFLAGLGLSLIASSVAAEGFTTEDLGSVESEGVCLERSQLVFFSASVEMNVDRVVPSDWTVSAFDISGDGIDAQITCAYGPNNTTRATLVVYSSDASSDQEREFVASRLREIWEDQN